MKKQYLPLKEIWEEDEMLTRIKIRNFKKFADANIELNENVVFVGPNNSGKTTALQALALWDIGYRQWKSKKASSTNARKRVGFTINRRDLATIPLPSAKLLWKNLHVREMTMEQRKQKTSNIRIEITVEGISEGRSWECGFEFDFANDESFYCRPLRLKTQSEEERMEVPDLGNGIPIAFLPPMSGLSDREFLKMPGEISGLLGQGQTADVLRNLCYRISSNEEMKDKWIEITNSIESLFGVKLLEPDYLETNSEIIMQYKDQSGITFDLSSSGRGLQQVLLLLAHMYSNPGSVLLLDEPDAHLEILRQRQIYHLLVRVAKEQGSQIISASHSEVVLNEAATRGSVVVFLGEPHLLANRTSHVLKSLKDIGFDQYYQAEQKGWVLYLEDATDLAILKAFASRLNHPAIEALETPFVHYVASNLPNKAREHFYGLKEAKLDLKGYALFDHLDKELKSTSDLIEKMWEKNEIENYFCTEKVLMKYAAGGETEDLFSLLDHDSRVQAMKESIEDVRKSMETLRGQDDLWSHQVKASDEVLDPIFRVFSKKLGLRLAMRKNQYSALIQYMDIDDISQEIIDTLDEICKVAKSAEDLTGIN